MLFLICLLIILPQSINTETNTPFLVTICDVNKGLVCFGALIHKAWVLASLECSLELSDKSLMTIHGGIKKTRCASPYSVTNVKEVTYASSGIDLFLVFYHLLEEFTLNRYIAIISPFESQLSHAVGTTCQAYSFSSSIHQKTDPKLEVHNVRINFCNEEQKYLCASLKNKEADIRNSPVRCDGKLLGIIWDPDSMHSMILFTSNELLSAFIKSNSVAIEPVIAYTIISLAITYSKPGIKMC